VCELVPEQGHSRSMTRIRRYTEPRQAELRVSELRRALTHPLAMCPRTRIGLASGTSRVGPGAEDPKQHRAGLRREPAELLVELPHLGAQGPVSSGEGPKRGLRTDRTGERARTKTGAGAHQPGPRQPS
jgi:hypothetical protein